MMMDQEDQISSIAGSFGLWQAGVVILVALVKVPSAWHMLGVLFKAPTVDFWCLKPKTLAYLPTAVWINLSHPIRTIKSDLKYYDPCEIYDVGYEDILENHKYEEIDVSDYARNFSYHAERRPCHEFQYDSSLFQETVVTEWHLVCNRKILVNVSQFFYLFGILIGGLTGTLLIPRVGPRCLFLFGAAVQIVTGTATAYAPLLEINIALRFTAASGCAFMFTAGFVICKDITWGKSKVLICAFYEWFWSIGVMSLPGLCLLFGTTSWRSLQIAISVPTCLLLLIAFFFVPESPRWLLENGRTEEAEKIVRRMAEVNGRPIPSGQSLNLQIPSRTIPANHNKTRKHQTHNKWLSWIALFHGPGSGKIIALHLLWATTIVTYYGALLNVKNLGDNLFINIFIAGIAEIVGVILGALIILYTKRKKWTWLGAIMLIGGFSCIASWFLLFDKEQDGLKPLSYIRWHQWVLVGLAMVGRIAVASSLTLLQVTSFELIPIAQRPVVSLSTITFARICLLSAPFIGYLAIFGECVSLTAFGSLTILGGIASISLSTSEQFSVKFKLRNIWTIPGKQGILIITQNNQQTIVMETIEHFNPSFIAD